MAASSVTLDEGQFCLLSMSDLPDFFQPDC